MCSLREPIRRTSREQTRTELTAEHVTQLTVRAQQRRQAALQAVLRVRAAVAVRCCLLSGVLSSTSERRQPAEDQRLQDHLRQRLQGDQ